MQEDTTIITTYAPNRGASQYINGASERTESICNAEDLGVIPGLGTSPGGGHGYPLQYSCLANSIDKSSLIGYSPRVTDSWTQLKD